jgi:uncharacterized protein YndB with AHSA1/START domain
MRKYTVVGVGILVGVVAFIAIVGLLLPMEHHASRTATVAASPDKVFSVISDVARYAEWRSAVTKVDVLPDDGGGLRFREHGGDGPIVFRIEQADPPHTLRVRIDDPGQPFGGTWTYELAPDGAGTSVTITEDGEVYNPIFRFMSRFVLSQTATIEAYLAALQHRLSGLPQ